MHRALGGAPVSREHWRSLGRSLRANAKRVRRSCGLRRVGAAQATASSPDTLLQAKTKFFLGVRPHPAFYALKAPTGRDAAPLPVNTLKQKHGAGVVRARPPHNYRCLRQNLVRANFAVLLKERTKNQKFKETKNSLIIIFLW